RRPRSATLFPYTTLFRSAEELDFHRRALVVDAHSDVTEAIRYEQYDLGRRHEDHHEDLPRMREGGLKAQFFSVFVQPGRFRPEQDRKSTRLNSSHQIISY